MSAVPSSFGKYFLTEKIATGGMAEIYLAKLLGPDGFEKYLIIKKIHPELSNQRQFVEMFVAEAKTLVSLSHGNIVPIYELGMVDSSYFIAMEYIDGPTLGTLLATLRKKRVSISVAMAAYICAELLKGLDYAHRKGDGVIHRDLSPRNVMFSREGEVKLVDFGIAIAHTENSELIEQSELPSGSYPHMSPEQVAGDSLDPRSDLFAMGILLWEMLSGRSLFARDSDQATLDAVKSASIDPPSDYCPDCEGVLDSICERALQRDKDLRYKSADEFLVAINRFLYSQSETITSQTVSAFIAKHCPPTVSEFTRPATIAPSSNKPSRAGTAPFERGDRVPRKRSGTVPLDHGQGKRRAETVRTFATNVSFKKNFISESDEAAATEKAQKILEEAIEVPQNLSHQQQSAIKTPVDGPETTMQMQTSLASDNKAAPRPILLWALLGIFLLGAIGITILKMSGDSSEELAHTPLPDAAQAAQAEADAAPSLVDAASPVIADATPLVIVDARKARIVKVRRPDARAKPPALLPGSIRIGANPWADVYVDGKSVGRAPGSFPLAAGKHSIELRFRDKSKTLTVNVKPGQLSRLGVVDFLAAP